MSNAMTAFIGRILFAVPMILFGVFHLMKPSGMAGQVLQGWPAATFLVVLSGIGLILAGIALAINKMSKLAMLLLALELLIFVLAIHIPAVAGGGGQQAMIGLLKDISLMGGALLAAGYYGGQSSSA
jgi:uncharacterized membrane protein YphA (DoxX/SURF4 family)